MGYLAAWFGESAGTAAIIFAIIPFFNYLFGSCYLFIFIADDITKDLRTFNTAVAASTETKSSNASNRAELINQFCAVIQFYADAKEYAFELVYRHNLWSTMKYFYLLFRCIGAFNHIYKYSLFAFFVWIMLLLSSALVAIQFLIVEYKVNCIQ